MDNDRTRRQDAVSTTAHALRLTFDRAQLEDVDGILEGLERAQASVDEYLAEHTS
jgi:hypothetical protein